MENSVFARSARKAFLLLLGAMLFILPLLLIPLSTQNPAVHSKELGLRFFLAVLGVLFVAAWPALPRRRWGLVDVAFLGVTASGLLATVFSSRPMFSLFEAWQNWTLPLLAWMIVRVAPTTGEAARLVIVIATSAMAAAIYGVSAFLGWDFLHGIYPFLIKTEDGRNYVHSLLGNPEYFGGYVAAVSAVALLQLLRGGKPARLAIWLVVAVFLLFALLLSGTRGAGIGFVLAVALVLSRVWSHLSHRLRRITLWGVLLLGVLTAAGVVVLSTSNPLNTRNVRLAQRFASLFDLNSTSMRERVLFYSVSGKMIARHPVLGDGPGTYQLNFYPTVLLLQEDDPRAGVLMMTEDLKGGVADHAHNDYLEIWADRGTVGLAAVLFFLSVFALKFIRLNGGQGELPMARDRMLLAVACFGGAICIFINAAFSFPLHMVVRGNLAWVLAAIFVALVQPQHDALDQAVED